MSIASERIRTMDSETRTKLFNLQKKYIQLETKLMFERDKNTKRAISNQLKELNKKRWEILHSHD